MRLEGEEMEHIQYRFLLTAIIGVIFLIGIGIMIAENSPIGIIICIIGTFVTVGYGFVTKKKNAQITITLKSKKLIHSLLLFLLLSYKR